MTIQSYKVKKLKVMLAHAVFVVSSCLIDSVLDVAVIISGLFFQDSSAS